MEISKPNRAMNLKHSDWRHFPVGRRRGISDLFISILLFIANFIRIKPLKIKSISFLDYLVVPGHPIPIFLDVSGCYKIIVSGYGSMPGSISSFTIRSNQNAVTLEIQFMGVWRSESRIIHFSGNPMVFLTGLGLEGNIPEFKTHSLALANGRRGSHLFTIDDILTSSIRLDVPELIMMRLDKQLNVPEFQVPEFADGIVSSQLQIKFDSFDQKYFSDLTDG